MRYKRISEIAGVQTGPFGSQLHKEDYVFVGTPIVTVEHLGSRTFTEQNLPQVSDSDKERLSKYILKEGDIVFSRVGSVDRCSYVDKNHDGWMFSGRCLRVRPYDIVDSLFLYYFFCLERTKEHIRNIAVGATMPSINTKFLGEVEIALPRLEVQRKIVAILSALDDKIELNQKINDNLLDQMQLLYQNLLDSCECSLIRLEEVSQKIAMGPFGSNIKVSTFVPEGVPIISGNHLRSVFLEEPSYNYITGEHAQKLKNSIVYPRDIVFTHAGNIGQVAMIPEGCDYPYYMISQRQFYMRCDEGKIIPEIVLFFFHSREGRGKLLANANSTGVPSIAQPSSHLKNIEMPMPSKKDQDEWYKVIGPMVKEYVALCQESKRLVVLRDSLLPKLMSGEIDVSDIQ